MHTKIGTSGGSSYSADVGIFAEGGSRSIIQMSSINDAYLMFGDAAQGNRAWLGYQHSNDQLSLHTSSTITMDGNVGIGTTSPTHKLHVAGTTAHTTVKVSTTTHNANFEVKTDNSNFALIGQGSSNRFDIWDTNAGATRLSVNSSGNVGIGSTNPSYKLDVVGSAGNTARFKGSGGQATVSINDGTNDNYIVALSGDLQLRPSGTTVLTTKSSGNVGIGSTSPTSKLTVAVGDIETSGVGYGIILKSPDGTRYRVTVANGGTLSVSAV